jgi:hypothetical protein
MSAALRFARGLAGLFFDDASLAIAVLIVLASTAILLHAAWLDESTAIAFLIGGVVMVLVENILRTSRAVRSR